MKKKNDFWGTILVISILVLVAVSIKALICADCMSSRFASILGSVLSSCATVLLGLIAFWQNKRFKEENDKAQMRLENLSNKANELSVVSKIIEYESENLSQLKDKMQRFIDACNTESTLVDLSDMTNQPSNFKNLYVKIKMDNRHEQIRLCGIELLFELKKYHSDDKVIELVDLISQYCECSIALVKEIRVGLSKETTYTKKIDVEKKFITSIYEFILNREILLNEVIYENLTLDEIKSRYHRCLNKEEIPNEQNEILVT